MKLYYNFCFEVRSVCTVLHFFTQKLLQIYLTMETIKLGSFIRFVAFLKSNSSFIGLN